MTDASSSTLMCWPSPYWTERSINDASSSTLLRWPSPYWTEDSNIADSNAVNLNLSELTIRITIVTLLLADYSVSIFLFSNLVEFSVQIYFCTEFSCTFRFYLCNIEKKKKKEKIQELGMQ